jgi:hypothetical protein
MNELSDFVTRVLTMKNGIMVSKDDNHASSLHDFLGTFTMKIVR